MEDFFCLSLNMDCDPRNCRLLNIWLQVENTSDPRLYLICEYEHIILFLLLTLCLPSLHLLILDIHSAAFRNGAISQWILFKIHFVSHLYATLLYVSLEYFYASKPPSSVLFSLGAEWLIEKRSWAQRRDSSLKPYSVTVIDRILNSLNLKSYDISYRFSFPPKEHPLSGKQTWTFSTCAPSQVSSDNKVHWCERKTWDSAWRRDPAWNNETD